MKPEPPFGALRRSVNLYRDALLREIDEAVAAADGDDALVELATFSVEYFGAHLCIVADIKQIAAEVPLLPSANVVVDGHRWALPWSVIYVEEKV